MIIVEINAVRDSKIKMTQNVINFTFLKYDDSVGNTNVIINVKVRNLMVILNGDLVNNFQRRFHRRVSLYNNNTVIIIYSNETLAPLSVDKFCHNVHKVFWFLKSKKINQKVNYVRIFRDVLNHKVNVKHVKIIALNRNLVMFVDTIQIIDCDVDHVSHVNHKANHNIYVN